MFTHFKKLSLVRTLVAVAIVAACTGAAVAALSLTSANGPARLSDAAQAAETSAAFSVLSQPPIGHTASIDIPPRAVLAAVQGNHRIYAWEGSSAEAAAMEGSQGKTAPLPGNKICVIDQEVGGGRGSTCGPSATVKAHGIVETTEVFAPKPHTTVTVLVPNGVPSVTFVDRDGTSYEAKVTKNVVVVEDQNLAPQPSTAISFKLPNGTVEALQMPLPPGTP